MKRAVLSVGLLAVCGLAAPATSVAGAVCDLVTSIEIDTTGADLDLIIFDGRAYGQTFFAADTLVEAITVFRPVSLDTNTTPLRLYVTRVDSSGVPLVQTGNQLYTSALLEFPVSDGVHPLACTFPISPPLSLPGPGKYFFTVQEADCASSYEFLGRDHDPYPQGQAWNNETTLFCTLSRPVNRGADQDMCFRIDFCRTATPVKPTSWGRLKSIYR